MLDASALLTLLFREPGATAVADVIAQGLSGFDPDGAAVRAGEIMLEQLHELAAQRRDDELLEIMGRCVIPLYEIRARRKGYEVSTMKAMMDMIGLAGGPVRPPLVELRNEEIAILRAGLQKWQPWL